MRRLATSVVSVLLLSGGCGEESHEDPVWLRNTVVNSLELQGPGLQLQGPGLQLQGPGLQLQGPGLQLQGPGLQLQGPGLQLQGVEFLGLGVVLQGPGVVLQGVEIEGTTISGVAVKDGVSHKVSGDDFIGAELDLRLEAIVDGQPVVVELVLRINDIQQSLNQSDVSFYDLTYRVKGEEEWLPYCGDSSVAAIPLRGYWDSTGSHVDDANVLTFGCTNAVLAKCVLWGYRPWATAKFCGDFEKNKDCSEVTLRDHHQACTRMARADYCGDGTPATVSGTLIDIWDQLSPQIQTPFTDWPVEAEWTPRGASCLNSMRHPEFAYPQCFLDKEGEPMTYKDCGSLRKQRALLVNAFSAGG